MKAWLTPKTGKMSKDTLNLLTDIERMLRHRKPLEGEDPRLTRQHMVRAQRAVMSLRRAVQNGLLDAGVLQDLRALGNNLHINHPHHYKEVLEKLERSFPFSA